MAKKNYLKIEYTLTILIIAVIVMIIVPFDFESNAQADFISRWQDKYSRLEYMFNVINVHEKDEIIKSFKHANTKEERENIIIGLIQPYFRIRKEKLPKRYQVKFMNKIKVPKSSKYYFEDTYTSENGMIVGIKNLDTKSPDEPMFIMMFDINGILQPNTWGKDIYGVNIYEHGLEAFGQNMSIKELEMDCSILGTGLGCSYYYKIGGGFND